MSIFASQYLVMPRADAKVRGENEDLPIYSETMGVVASVFGFAVFYKGLYLDKTSSVNYINRWNMCKLNLGPTLTMSEQEIAVALDNIRSEAKMDKEGKLLQPNY